MSGKVIRLATLPNNMLATVENLVQWCEDGAVESLAICAVDKEGNVLSALVAETALFTLLGAVADMQRTITDKIERR